MTNPMVDAINEDLKQEKTGGIFVYVYVIWLPTKLEKNFIQYVNDMDNNSPAWGLHILSVKRRKATFSEGMMDVVAVDRKTQATITLECGPTFYRIYVNIKHDPEPGQTLYNFFLNVCLNVDKDAWFVLRDKIFYVEDEVIKDSSQKAS